MLCVCGGGGGGGGHTPTVCVGQFVSLMSVFLPAGVCVWSVPPCDVCFPPHRCLCHCLMSVFLPTGVCVTV